MKILSVRGLAFLGLFALLAFVGLKINMFSIQGASGKAFTLFEFFGPMAGGFLGLAGVAAVGIAKITAAIAGGTAFTFIDLVKLTPMMFAAYYFWRNGSRGFSDKLGMAIPVLAMAAFWLHPIALQMVIIAIPWLGWVISLPAGIYSLFWTIPILVKFLPDRLFLRSLGATFTAHAIGSVLFLYTIPNIPALWIGLIPVVAVERTIFALGITFSYLVFTNVLNAVDTAYGISKDVTLEKRYVLQLQD